MIKGLDFGWGRFKNINDVTNQGFKFICRYLSWEGNDKNLTLDETRVYRGAGLQVVPVFETGETRALGGFNQGRQDAQAALDQARRREVDNEVIYFAVDFEPLASQYPIIGSYFDGIAQILPKARGGYGGFGTIKYLLDTKRITHAWQTKAWSHGLTDSRINILQEIGYVYVSGVQCDVNYGYNLNGDADMDWDTPMPNGDWASNPQTLRSWANNVDKRITELHQVVMEIGGIVSHDGLNTPTNGKDLWADTAAWVKHMLDELPTIVSAAVDEAVKTHLVHVKV